MTGPTHRRLVRRADAAEFLLLWHQQGWAPVAAPEALPGTVPGDDDVLVVVLGPLADTHPHLLAPSASSVWAADAPHAAVTPR